MYMTWGRAQPRPLLPLHNNYTVLYMTFLCLNPILFFRNYLIYFETCLQLYCPFFLFHINLWKKVKTWQLWRVSFLCGDARSITSAFARELTHRNSSQNTNKTNRLCVNAQRVTLPISSAFHWRIPGGARDAPPPLGLISLIFIQFLAKIISK